MSKKKLAAIPYILGSRFVSVTFNGQPFTIYSDDKRYIKVIEALKVGDRDALEIALSIKTAVSKLSYGKVLIKDGELRYKKKVISHSLVDKILQFYEDGFDVKHLLRFLNKVLKNPDPKSSEQLYSYLELYRMPITESGNFLAMKAVRADFLDKYSKTILNRIGKQPRIKRSLCSDSSSPCGPSLHCGNIEYIKWYGSSGDQVVLVEVNPKDVIGCPKDHAYKKLRVCKYKVVAELGDVDSVIDFDKLFMSNTEIHKISVDKNEGLTSTQPTQPKRDGKGRFVSTKK